LKKLPDDIGCLRKMEEFVLMGNPIEELPISFGECYSMEIMDISCCELMKLPV
jgi:hypothetical protein